MADSSKTHRYITEAYTRCDKKDILFHIDRSFTEKTGCPIMYFKAGTEPEMFPPSISWLEFTASTLTKEELKVFAAWEKNMKTNPVTGSRQQ